MCDHGLFWQTEHRVGGADFDAGRIRALLAHDRHRKPFALPRVHLDARSGGPKLSFLGKRASQHAVSATGAFFGVDHQDLGHNPSPAAMKGYIVINEMLA
jgi:hypothetical protein